ncbi:MULTISPECIES: sulfurtransferase TusA family protein [Acetobacter]|uniref:sulfurtransferase TusA family protein n=1 Tax=Acetobacter TaxID=434 RepID=UPI000A3AD326|nr:MULTISPECIES: sulfurtransferase TusA family protein [Acetobacter]MBS0960234.1 sulfurtransferase TusA family protein [Acetobacter thailandicus]MBS0979738.1 sulfurtransferase TusA family protein [Acetobacter thailandicus]MBS0985458.1 sulfurtransferase TusA family protein [Acetobacter thailandicus]OUJ11438.1 hypothetical protein HK25_00915 [Acetobacter sp. DsW_059]
MLDITGEKCPMTFVRTRLALDALAPGGHLQVRLKTGETYTNVTRSVRQLGHQVLDEHSEAEDVVVLRIQKAGG